MPPVEKLTPLTVGPKAATTVPTKVPLWMTWVGSLRLTVWTASQVVLVATCVVREKLLIFTSGLAGFRFR